METVAAAFTDHLAVILGVTFDVQSTQRGQGYWRMNASLINEPAFLHTLQEEWERWQKQVKRYPNRVLWWDRYVKRMIRQTFQRVSTKRRRDRVTMENFYYDVIYRVLQDPANYAKKAIALKRLKPKIIRLNNVRQLGVLLDSGDPDRIVGEELSVRHYIKATKRQKVGTVHQIRDQEGTLQRSSADILRTFSGYMR